MHTQQYIHIETFEKNSEKMGWSQQCFHNAIRELLWSTPLVVFVFNKMVGQE